MACHIRYFASNGSFRSREYAKNMGIKLEENTIGGKRLSDEESGTLQDAIARADADSGRRQLRGVMDLIRYVEHLQDEHGVRHFHKHESNFSIIGPLREDPVLSDIYKNDIETYLRPEDPVQQTPFVSRAPVLGDASAVVKEYRGASMRH